MKKIVEIIQAKLSQLLNNDHSVFIKEVIALVKKFDPKKLKIEKEIIALQDSFAKESAVLDPVRSSEYTEPMRLSDEARTAIAKGLEGFVRATVKNPDTATAEAATRLNLLFKSHADLHNKSYSFKTGVISDILAEINLKYTGDVEKIAVVDWVTKLDTENKHFIALEEKRYEEEALRNAENMTTVRKEVDDAYLTLTTRLTALMIIEEPEKFYPFVNELNSHVKHYNERVKQRQTINKNNQKDIATAQMSSIGDRPYTGEEIIPSFDLIYTDPKTASTGSATTVLLEKGKDYTVECINNTAIGTATLTAHGKGAYVGKLVTRFNIIAVG